MASPPNRERARLHKTLWIDGSEALRITRAWLMQLIRAQSSSLTASRKLQTVCVLYKTVN
jgi:hypothetical protein